MRPNWLLIRCSLFAVEGTESQVVHRWPLPIWLAVVLSLAVVAFAWWVYYRQRTSIDSFWERGKLTVARATSMLLVVAMMFGWILEQYRTDLPDLVIAVDVSQSMAREDLRTEADWQDVLNRKETPEWAASRLNLAKWALGQALDKSLQERYNVRAYAIGESATGLGSGTEIIPPSLQATDASSRLGDSLEQILLAQRGRPTAAVVLVTDGAVTHGTRLEDIAQQARQKRIPIFVAGVGTGNPPQDLELIDLVADDVVFVRDLIQFDFKVVSRGLQDTSVQVRLKRAGDSAVLDQQSTALTAAGSESMQLVYRPETPGDYEFSVEIEAVTGEEDLANNSKTVTVRVRDRKLRVLYVQGTPSYEYRFLKDTLERVIQAEGEETIELMTLLQDADRRFDELEATALRVFPTTLEDLESFDVILFGDVDRSRLGSSAETLLVRYVTERGGSLIFLCGPRHLPQDYRTSPLALLLPVRLGAVAYPPSTADTDASAVVEDEFRVQLSELGARHPAMRLAESAEANAAVWEQLTRLRWYVSTEGVKPGTQVLAHHPTQPDLSGQPVPLISFQFVGVGQVLMLATDELYRWARGPADDSHYQRFWLQWLRFLSRSRLEREGGIRIELDREQGYLVGEEVIARVLFLNTEAFPDSSDEVLLALEHESGRRDVLGLRAGRRRGEFVTGIRDLAAGKYRLVLIQPAIEDVVAREFSVRQQLGESRQSALRDESLREVAAASRGAYQPLQQLDQLVRRLPRGRPVQIAPLPSRPIWNRWYWPLAIIVLLTLEWTHRKRLGLT